MFFEPFKISIHRYEIECDQPPRAARHYVADCPPGPLFALSIVVKTEEKKGLRDPDKTGLRGVGIVQSNMKTSDETEGEKPRRMVTGRIPRTHGS